MPYRTDIQVRFADTDALGHVNNSAFAHYAEHARIEFFQHLGGRVGGLILARLAIDFRRQVHFGTTVMVETGVERVGTSSIALRQGIYAVGDTAEVAAEVESVVVHFAEVERGIWTVVERQFHPQMCLGGIRAHHTGHA